MHVIWTDYVSSALLYECYRVEADQRCSPGADHITMLSRTHNMSQTVYDALTLRAVELCFTREELGHMLSVDEDNYEGILRFTHVHAQETHAQETHA